MLGSFVVSAVFVLMGVAGLFLAAWAADDVARVMGFGMVVLAWLLMLGYHGRRAERSARERSEQH